MKLFRYIIDFVKKIAASRMAQIFFLIHLIVLTTAFIKAGEMFPLFHTTNDTRLLNILAIVNAPSSLITLILFLPVSFLQSLFYAENSENSVKFFTVLMYISWQIQWALIGYVIGRILTWRRKGNENY
jgi:hypothetical protein